ncbi:MAG: hypothetical protein GXO26_02090 [Crenarchaeota archaeon]|jgi:signal-transduction protein with cAMP-binding, CBS, and nucleotidyltransferase domain|nr:hypothetical protein [Thermoproteota archaeon]
MSEGAAVSVSQEEILSKAREIIVRLRDLERRAEVEDLKKVWQELKDILREARQYGLDKSFVPLVRKIKAIIERRRLKMLKEKFKSQQASQSS